MESSEDITNFIDSLPIKRKKDLNKLREIIYKSYPFIRESVKNNILNFKLNEISLFVFGSQKQYMCFYISKALLNKHKAGLKGLNHGAGTIRFNDIEKINTRVLERIIKEANEFPFEYSKRGDYTK